MIYLLGSAGGGSTFVGVGITVKNVGNLQPHNVISVIDSKFGNVVGLSHIPHIPSVATPWPHLHHSPLRASE